MLMMSGTNIQAVLKTIQSLPQNYTKCQKNYTGCQGKYIHDILQNYTGYVTETPQKTIQAILQNTITILFSKSN